MYGLCKNVKLLGEKVIRKIWSRSVDGEFYIYIYIHLYSLVSRSIHNVKRGNNKQKIHKILTNKSM